MQIFSKIIFNKIEFIVALNEYIKSLPLSPWTIPKHWGFGLNDSVSVLWPFIQYVMYVMNMTNIEVINVFKKSSSP